VRKKKKRQKWQKRQKRQRKNRKRKKKSLIRRKKSQRKQKNPIPILQKKRPWIVQGRKKRRILRQLQSFWPCSRFRRPLFLNKPSRLRRSRPKILMRKWPLWMKNIDSSSPNRLNNRVLCGNRAKNSQKTSIRQIKSSLQSAMTSRFQWILPIKVMSGTSYWRRHRRCRKKSKKCFRKNQRKRFSMSSPRSSKNVLSNWTISP
jgi:hypothetical protein